VKKSKSKKQLVVNQIYQDITMDFGQVVGPAEARMIICLRDKGNIISSVPWKTCHEMYHGSQQKSKVNSGIGVEKKSSLTALIAGFIRLKLNLHQWLAE